MNLDPEKIYAKITTAGEEWAEADAAASILEETRKTLIAELSLKAVGSSATEKERQALADPVYKLHITNMVTARKEANRARVRYESAKMWAELRRSLESTKRAEMNLR